MKRIFPVLLFSLLVFNAGYSQNNINWKGFGAGSRLFESVYKGHFGNIRNDIYFKMLFLNYISHMSSSCSDYLPSDRLKYDVEVSGMKEVYSHTLFTGINSMPFLDMYNRENTSTTKTVYVDSRFKTIADQYSSEQFAQNLVMALVKDYEKFADITSNTLFLFKSFGCGSIERKRFGENLLRFANGSTPFYSEEKDVASVKREPLPVDARMADSSPVFPGCENLEKYETSNCFNKMVLQHIKDNHFFPEELKNKRIAGKVYVSMVISEDGTVKDISARMIKGSNKDLEDVAVKIMESLPKMKPAMHDGKIVSSYYSVPIIFKM